MTWVFVNTVQDAADYSVELINTDHILRLQLVRERAGFEQQSKDEIVTYRIIAITNGGEYEILQTTTDESIHENPEKLIEGAYEALGIRAGQRARLAQSEGYWNR